MSRLIFSDTYIAVIPSYEETGVHKHSMLHVFVGDEILSLPPYGQGRIMVLEQNVEHERPQGRIRFFLFVDPTSAFAEKLRSEYLRGAAFCASETDQVEKEISEVELTEEGIRRFVIDHFGVECFVRRKSIDPRVLRILNRCDHFQYLNIKVKEIAREMNYSESLITHLFKRETGVSLKSYLLLRKVEFVWKQIASGKRITTAVMEGGFASPSHFSDTCKKLTGISAAEVLKR